MISKLNAYFYNSMLSEKIKNKVERLILIVAIISFLAHLVAIYLVKNELIMIPEELNFFDSPIAAIYTPFSFILLYEVYLLIYYLPKSFTTYISKQYEIMTLILIRRLFKDLSALTTKTDWFTINIHFNFLTISLAQFYYSFLFICFTFRAKNIFLSRN